MIKTRAHWKRLKGVEAWLPELRRLLAEAAAAAQQTASGPRLSVAQLLAGFIQESWPQTPEMDRLDHLAQETVTSLMLADMEQRLGALAGRTAEYAKLEKELAAAVERNAGAAAALRLEGVQRVIETTTRTIASARTLAASLDEAKRSEQKVARLIESTVAAVENLRSEAARLI